MNSKNKLQEIKSSDEKVINKKLLKDLYKNEKRLQCKINTRDKRIKTLKDNIKELKVENKSLMLENENLEYEISHLNKMLDESHKEIALLKIDARLDDEKSRENLKTSKVDYASLKKESESKIIDLNLEIISKNEEIIELKEENKLAEEEIKNLKKELELSNERIEELYTELLNDIGDYDFNFKLETCPKCGAVVGEDSNYCVECGSKL